LSASIFGMPIFSISSLAWASLSRSIWTLAASSSRLKPSSSRAIDSRASMSACWSPSCFSRRAIAAASWVFWMPRREASSACSRAIDDSSLMPCKRVWVWAWRRAFAREAALLADAIFCALLREAAPSLLVRSRVACAESWLALNQFVI
jgi:hypothetical protein